MFLLLYGMSDGQALAHGFYKGLVTVIILIPIFAIIAFLKKDKRKNSSKPASQNKHALKYENAVSHVNNTAPSPTDHDGEPNPVAADPSVPADSQAPSSLDSD